MDEDETVMGTFNGIPGTLTCTAGLAESLRRYCPGVAAGTVQSMTGGWAFESTENHESAAAQKMDYLYFGYWLQANEEDNEFAFASFAGGGMAFDTGDRHCSLWRAKQPTTALRAAST